MGRRAADFSARFADRTSEQAEAQSFWNEFLQIFGIDRKAAGGEFERHVQLGHGAELESARGVGRKSDRGRIDFLLPGWLLAEHKSSGQDLNDALRQGLEYARALPQSERPLLVVACDFSSFLLQKLNENGETVGRQVGFPLAELEARVLVHFGFFLNLTEYEASPVNPVDEEAVKKMEAIRAHIASRDAGVLQALSPEARAQREHQLQTLLVRAMFLFFADDSGMWDDDASGKRSGGRMFNRLLREHTAEDGSDLFDTLRRLFETLNTPENEREPALPERYAKFPYVNGDLFDPAFDELFVHEPDEDEDGTPERPKIRPQEIWFDEHTRRLLIGAAEGVNWLEVNPVIFGSMFQAVMNPEQRRNLGAHYTSKTNIYKVLGPLFLDELEAELQAHEAQLHPANRRLALEGFVQKLRRLRFFDPACGSGNFLLLAYEELRRLELRALRTLHEHEDGRLIAQKIGVSVDQFYGIEIEPFAARIANVAMWMTEHLCNREASKELKCSIVKLPLQARANVACDDALKKDWLRFVAPAAGTADALYILGNPPFVGVSMMTKEQKASLQKVFGLKTKLSKLDFVGGWYRKAASLMWTLNKSQPEMTVRTSLVSTNSVTQGDQVATLWEHILGDEKEKGLRQVITAAHQTFSWQNEAKGNAGVHCVIVQFEPASQVGANQKRRLFEYQKYKGDPIEKTASFINAYLIDGPEAIVRPRNRSFFKEIQPILYGSKPTDGGGLIFDTSEEKEEFLKRAPEAAPWVKEMLDAKTFLNGGTRWCLWLEDATPDQLEALSKKRAFKERLDRVETSRLASTKAATRELAKTPALFEHAAHPDGDYLAVPRTTSENRYYVPIRFLTSEIVVNDRLSIIPNATHYTFGVVQSRLHMIWMRLTAGRLKSDYNYSGNNVYNTFPWPDPEELTPQQIAKIETAAAEVLAQRTEGQSLAALYDPRFMPAELRKAHKALDRAVEALYQLPKDNTDSEALAMLLDRYNELREKELTEREKASGKTKL